MKKKKLKQGGEEVGGTLPYPQKRICNSAASSPNYSGALLKSATKLRQRKSEKKSQKEREREKRMEERGRQKSL